MESASVAERPFGQTEIASVVDVYFQDEAAMHAAMASASGKQLARVLMAHPRTAPDMIVCHVAEHGR